MSNALDQAKQSSIKSTEPTVKDYLGSMPRSNPTPPAPVAPKLPEDLPEPAPTPEVAQPLAVEQSTPQAEFGSAAVPTELTGFSDIQVPDLQETPTFYAPELPSWVPAVKQFQEGSSPPPLGVGFTQDWLDNIQSGTYSFGDPAFGRTLRQTESNVTGWRRWIQRGLFGRDLTIQSDQQADFATFGNLPIAVPDEGLLGTPLWFLRTLIDLPRAFSADLGRNAGAYINWRGLSQYSRSLVSDPQPFGLFRDPAERERMLTSTKPADTVANRWANLEAVVSGQVPNYGFMAVRDFGDTNNTFGEFTEEEIRGWELDPANTLREQFRTNYEERTTVNGRRLSFTFMSELPHAILDNFRLGVAIATNNRPSVALRAMKATTLDMLLDPLPIIGPAADIARMISGSRVAVGRTAVVPFTQTSPGNGAYRTAQQMGLDLQAPLEALDLSSLDDATFIRALELLQQERGLSRVEIIKRNPQLFERLREISARPPSSAAQPTVDVAQGTVQAAPAPIQVGPPVAPQAPLVSTPDDFVDVTTDLSVEAQAYSNALRQWDAWANTVEDLEALLTPEAQPLPATLPVQAAPAPTQVGPYAEPQAPLDLDTTDLSFIEVTPDMSVEALAHAQAYNTALRQWDEWFPRTPEALPAPEAQPLPAAPLPAIGAGSKGRDAIRSAVQAAAPTQPVTPQVQSMAAFTRTVRQTPYVDTILNQPAPVTKVPPTAPLAGVTPEVVDTVIKQIEAENLPAQIVRLRSEQVELGRRFLADLDADVLPQLDAVTANLVDTVDAYNGVEILKAAQESGDLGVVQALAQNLDVVDTPTGTVATVTDQPNPRQLLNAEYNQVQARWAELDDLDRDGLLDPMSAEGEELVLLDERLRDLEYQIKQLDPDGLTSMTSAVALGRAIEADLFSIQPDVTPAVLDEAMEDLQRIGQDAIEGKPTQAQAELNQVAASIGARIDPVPVQTRENIRVTHQQYLDSIRTDTYTVKELRQVAKDLGISGTYKLNKKALRDYLEKWLADQIAPKDDLVRAENGDILLYRGTGNQQPDFVPPQQAVKPVKKIGSEYYLVSVDNITAPPKPPGLSDELLNQQAEAIAATGALLKPVVVVRNPEAAATYTLVSDAETYYTALKTKELYPKLGEHVSAVVADDEATAALYKEQLSILNEVGPEPILTPSAAPVTEQVGAEYYLVPLKQVTTSAQTTTSVEIIDQLVQSRAAAGTFVQPVVVVRTGPQSYELVHGSAVYEAALKFKQLEPRLGEMVPAFVVEGGSLEAAKHQLELLGSKAPAVLDRAKTPRPAQAVDEVDDVGQLPLEATPPPKPVAAKAKPLGLASAKPVAQPAQVAPSASTASIEAEIAAVEAKLDKALNNNNFKAADALDRKLDKLKADLARQRKADAEFKDVVPHVPAKPTRPASILDATVNGKPLLEGDALESFNRQIYGVNESLKYPGYLDALKQYTYIVPTAPKPEESDFAAGLKKFMEVNQPAITQEQIEKLAILTWYTFDLFKPLNKALRGNPNMFNWSAEQAVAIGEYFDEALDIIKLSKSEKVYRAVPEPDIRPQYIEGKVLQNPGYTSTSTVIDVGFSFGGDEGVYYTIEDATGYPMHFLSEVYEEEFELLLPRNSTFKVLEVNRETNNITLRQLDSPPKLADGESLPKLSKAGAAVQPTGAAQTLMDVATALEDTSRAIWARGMKLPKVSDVESAVERFKPLGYTEDQAASVVAVEQYTGQAYSYINAYLRFGEEGLASELRESLTKLSEFGATEEALFTVGDSLVKLIPLIDEGIKLPLYPKHKGTVYRGIVVEELPAKYFPGAVVADPAFMSTSTDLGVVEGFMQSQQAAYKGEAWTFEIQDAVGARINETQKEVLLPRNTELEILSVDSDRKYIVAKQVSEPLFAPDNARPSTTTTRFTEEMFAEFMQTVEKLPPSTKRSILESLGEDPYAFWVRDKEEQAEYARLVELGVGEKEAQAEASKFADEVASNLRKPTTGSESTPMLGVGSGTESNLAYNSRTTYSQADLDKVEIYNVNSAGAGEKTNLERFQKAFEFVPRSLFDSLDWSNTVLLHQNDMELAIPNVPKDLSYGWSGATLRQGDKTYVILAGGSFESTTLVHELTHAYFYQIGKENRDVVLPNHAAFVVDDAEVVNYPGWNVVQGNVDRVVAEMVDTLGEELEPVQDYVQTAVEGLRKDPGYFTSGTIKPEESDALRSLADAAFNDVDNRVLYELMKGLPEGLSESYKIWLGQVANLKVVDQVLQELGLSTSAIESIELLQGLREVDTVNSFNNPINGYHGLEELITYRIGWDPNYFDTILTRTEPVIPSLQDVTKPTVDSADFTAKLSRAGTESSPATRGGLLPQRSSGYGSGIPGDSDLQTALLQFGDENEFGPGLYTSADVGRGAKYAQGVNRAKPGIQYGDPWVDSYRIDGAANIVRYSELGNYAELHRNGNYAALRELNAKALEDGVDVISTGSGDYIILNPRVVKGVERRAVPGLDTPLQMRAAEYNARLESELDTTVARQNLAQQGLLETGRQYSEILRQASQRYFDQAQQQFTEFAAVRKARKAVEDVQEGFSKIFDGIRKCL